MPLKDFVILTKLGEGAYSSVYKVKRVIDEEIYALKKVKMNNLNEKEQENALNEVRFLASVKNQYIVAYKQAFIEGGSLCIIMEFSDDGDLYQKISRYQKSKIHFEQGAIWRVLIDITLGLKKLHDLNILHRDLKSANVFLSKNGDAKLGDMNVSKIAKNGLLYTQTGTPYYASPEVWKDKPYDSKSDIWSLGCVIYEMVTLKPPFRADDMDGLYKRVVKGHYSKISNEYSDSLSSVIRSMLQVNPANRCNVKQLLHSLAHKAEDLGIDIYETHHIDESQLLKTIRPHQKLHYLTDRLPQSNYTKAKTQVEIKKKVVSYISNNSTQKTQQLIKNVNLPKVQLLNNGVGLKNLYVPPPKNNYKHQHQSKKPSQMRHIDVDGVNRRVSQGELIMQLQENRKADIKKVYSIKEPTRKVNQRIIQLPRIK